MSSPNWAVKTQGLTRRFGRLTAVDRVDYQVPRGSVAALIGPNGAGKTTLISMLAGYLRPQEGQGELLGFPLGHPELRGRFTVLPQDARLPPQRRCLELLAFWGELGGLGPAEALTAAREVLHAVGLGDRAEERAGNLSHGMAKRLGLAQAFLGQPELILLDEPTAGLDPRNAFEIRRLVGQLRGRATIIVSSHNLAELQSLCDHATILSKGRIVAQGPVEELTQADQEIRIEWAGKEPDLAALRGLRPVAEAEIVEDATALLVRFSSSEVTLDDGTAAVLRALLDGGTFVRGLSRGRSLEQRFLELTV